MGGDDFTLGLGIGAFLLAGWVDTKLGDSRPGTPARLTAHVIAGFVLLWAAVGVLHLVDGAGAPEAALLGTVLATFLPALAYALLTGLWLIRMLEDIRRLARR
jgi:hypothetical protein